MKISVILGHPKKGSFNHAIADAAIETLGQNGHAVCFHDLCEEQFDPLLPFDEIQKDAVPDPVIAGHCKEISEAEGIIVVHPNWWGQPPAILKGWIDRVLSAGVAYEFEEGDNGEGIPIGLLRAQAALVFNTANTPEEREQNTFGDPLEVLWKKCIFDLSGIHTFYRKMYGVVVTSTEGRRRIWLEDVRTTVDRYFPTEYGRCELE